MPEEVMKMMGHRLVLVILLVTISISPQMVLSEELMQNLTSVNGGRCPQPKMDTRLCSQQLDQCKQDSDCSGESICCSTGCNKVCILPSYTACEQVRSSAERRARSLEGTEEGASVPLPQCDPVTGQFKQIQCAPGKGCYCVDTQGFEQPGTRARALEAVNCSNPNPKCEGPMCRMFCPHGFELDEEGCEICECRNVCKGVKCPGSEQCEVLEGVPCSTEPCPPLPSCKQPRSLDSLCSFGSPLTMPESGKPFLCGDSPGKPSCPAAFECNVRADNDYGVCCAVNRNFDKPGACPVVATTINEESGETCENAATACRHDLDCSGFEKCCFTQRCGKRCSKPSNSTTCLQQKHIAELLSEKELEGKGYIPQCDELGNFIQKQCSRNGKVCWCVGADGKNFAQSIGSAESVNCTSITRQRAALRSDDFYNPTCDKVLCPPTIQCDYGFKTDRNGCPTCDCVESPCSYFNCPSGSECHMVNDSNVNEGSSLRPTCLSDSLFVNPCSLGSPLSHADSGSVVACSEIAPTCPSSHICVKVTPNKAGLCCPNKPRIENTKAGMCPFLAPSVCASNTNDTLNLNQKCGSDDECENSMKCCAAGDCTVCADPLLQEDLGKERSSPTMCQYLRDADNKVNEVLAKFKFAKEKPECRDDGSFKEIQCDRSHCMCVDEHGAEIPGTLMDKSQHNLTSEYCLAARVNPKCLEMNCRLSCDFGYENLDGCKICECRNPCMFRNNCGGDELCEMVDIDCVEGHCPPLPFCIPKALVAFSENIREAGEIPFSCPSSGSPFLSESNETLTCNPRARMLQCPDQYFCHDVITGENELGLCCPILSDAEGDHQLLQEGLNDDLGNYLMGERREEVHSKPGQCPYLIPFSAGATCDNECETDEHCPSSAKCCLNLCGGTKCSQPLLMTACQHQKQILEHKARESGTPFKHVFSPQCDESGEYVRIQSFGKHSWCVDSAGQEIQGTRVVAPRKPNCQKPAPCPHTKCSLQCEFGLNLDPSGCPVCECKPSPCETDVRCGVGEECRMMQLNCISEPCPPVPLCLPALSNPCPQGSPLTFEESGERVPCGFQYGASACPSSHKCNASPFGEYAVCCPKPKEVCLEPKEIGNCKAVIAKWFFNSSSNECQPFYHSGCGGNNNQFNTKAECLSVCPALSHCERIREKNSELIQKYRHMSYVPKCDSKTGEWEPVQCFEEVGMCWCVNKKGEPIKGTMTNGLPNCQRRRGRMVAAGAVDALPVQVCPTGITVHKCPLSTCEGKTCIDHPEAKCLINPCGGCHPKWVLENGEELHCTSGLTQCRKEVQEVMNSAAWINQGNIGVDTIIATSASNPGSYDYQDEVIQADEAPDHAIRPFPGPFAVLENVLREIIGDAGRRLRPQPPVATSTKTSTKVTPIYADFGNGNKVMGLMSSSVTIMGDSSEESKLPRRPNSPVQSIADILSDLMTSQTRQRSSYLSDDFTDLMPSSSSSSVSHSREMLLNPPAFSAFSDFPFIRSRRYRRDTADTAAEIEEDSEVPDNLAMESEGVGTVAVRAPPGFMVSILPRHKMGSCPPPSQFALFNLITRSCPDECHSDSGCVGGLKCCLSQCGLKCMAPQVIPDSTKIAILSLNPVGVEDEDVASTGSQSPTVLSPADEAASAPMMVVSIPDCDPETGDYSPVQSQGELSWCVSPEGIPIPDTFTRGKILCSSNGTVIQRRSTGPVCPDKDQTGLICKDQCLHAICPLHPDAVCVMDICHECQPLFFKPSGEQVRCEEKCSQPPADAGLCRASITKYSFNASTGRCEEFIYGGCQGTENNFETMGECQAECEGTVQDICHLPMKAGKCRASMLRWYYNPSTQSCESFDYGGCGGNGNNFMSKEHCESRCPDIVLCPEITAEGELHSCSRMTACRNVTCPQHQVDDFMCIVEPCSCQAKLQDFNGNEVNCEDLVVKPPQQSSGIFQDEIIDLENSAHETTTPSNFLHVQPTISFAPKSKCALLSERSSKDNQYSCDFDGRFAPKQCTTPNHCICVDESGAQVENVVVPALDCTPVLISRVAISLSFPIEDDSINSVRLGIEMQDLLRAMGAQLLEDKVDIEVLPLQTKLNFILIGDTKVDVSYWLELLVAEAAIGVQGKEKFVAADGSASKFNYVREPSWTSSSARPVEDVAAGKSDADNEIPVDAAKEKLEFDVIAAESLLDSEENTAILLTLVAAVSCGLVVFAMFLAFQKKKNSGSYPKKAFENLGFNLSIYEVEKKGEEGTGSNTVPTFKVTPYVNCTNEKKVQQIAKT